MNDILRSILKKYMEHVGECEGILMEPNLTPEEKAVWDEVLAELDKELAERDETSRMVRADIAAHVARMAE